MVRPPRPSGMTVQALLPGEIWLGRRWGLFRGATKWAGKRALSSVYWSSTSNADNPDNAQNINITDVNLQNGNDNKDNNTYVRAVRR